LRVLRASGGTGAVRRFGVTAGFGQQLLSRQLRRLRLPSVRQSRRPWTVQRFRQTCSLGSPPTTAAPVSAQDTFDAILALLSATSYTLRFAEDLEDVFPHAAVPSDHALFLEAAALGGEIRAVETFTRPPDAAFLKPDRRSHRKRGDRGVARQRLERGRAVPLRQSDRPSIRRQRRGLGLLGQRLPTPVSLARREGGSASRSRAGDGLPRCCGSNRELIDLFARADHLLGHALNATLSREVLGLAESGTDPPR